MSDKMAHGAADTHSVAVHFVKLVTDFIESRGLSAAGLLGEADLTPDDLNDPNGRVSFTKFDHLLNLTAKTLDEPCLGLKLGQSIRPGHLGSHGFALMSCSTGAELMQQHMRYSMLTIDAAHVVIEQSGNDYIRYLRSSLQDGAKLGRLQDELNMATTVAMARWFTNRNDLAPKWVSFQHPEPSDTTQYSAFFNCPVHFSRPETAVCVDGSYLLITLPHANPQLRQMMDDVCAGLVKQLGTALEPGWVAQARQLILKSFKEGLPDIASVADATNMSEEELKSQLAQRGTSFRGFVDELRQALALGYVRDPSLSLVDIAYLLGFSEQSAFQRAFKRWTGKTPGEYRKN
ncbi:AraC family transcriptional regulator [Alcanivorax sp. MD8A]|uniref:AraC family transcriptional regulator n=1 Tax=Alcanivorax sp. MD8A TaxID=1177157 RepID=UPI000C9C374E|nr:AraC family transcriptional regulator [Alcanivorax sp. MD8A]PNE02126.1 AraC family transcriptional regulator [Alcanivorax sp. MD8A]